MRNLADLASLRRAAEIAAMFAALDGYDRYTEALEIADQRKRAAAVENTRQWRLTNPARFRANRRAARRRWEKRYPEKYKAEKARYRERHKEHVRKIKRPIEVRSIGGVELRVSGRQAADPVLGLTQEAIDLRDLTGGDLWTHTRKAYHAAMGNTESSGRTIRVGLPSTERPSNAAQNTSPSGLVPV